jgi:dTDP-glucose 4,6-dehydratase
VIPTIISQLCAGKEKINLGAISPTRDFNFVSDTVDGFLSAIRCTKANGEVINIGSSFEISIGDTANLIAKIMNKKISIEEDKERMRPLLSEVERLYSSNIKARKILNWTPKYGNLSGFENGLEKTIEWFSDPHNLSNYNSRKYVI